MPEISVDEFLNARKGFVKGGKVVVKASKAPPSWDAEKRTARFVMSAEVEDRDRDIVVQDGIDVTEFMKNPIAPFSHRSSNFPIGTWSNIEKLLAGRPKRTEGDLTLVQNDPDADRLANHLSQGTIRAASIGFIPKSIERREVPEDKKDSYFFPGYMIHACELVECSPVTIPSNPAALAKSFAEGGEVQAKEMIEEILDNWAKDPTTGLLIPREEFEKLYWQVSRAKESVVATASPAKPETKTPHPNLARKLLDKLFGPENEALLQAALQAKSRTEENPESVLTALEHIRDNFDRRAKAAKRAEGVKQRVAAIAAE